MLNRNHPQTPHIFKASNLEDAILERAKRMTLVPISQRRLLLSECRLILNELHTLNAEHFGAKPFIKIALQDLEQSLNHLAEVPRSAASDDLSKAADRCTICGGTLTNLAALPKMPREIYCSSCLHTVMPAISRLRSDEGFETDWI